MGGLGGGDGERWKASKMGIYLYHGFRIRFLKDWGRCISDSILLWITLAGLEKKRCTLQYYCVQH